MRSRIRRLFEWLCSQPFRARQANLSRSRAPIAEAEFVDRIVAGGGDREAAALVWHRLQDWVCADGFSPYPDDDLQFLYGIAEEEFDEEFLLSTFGELHLPAPSADTLQRFATKRTPLDVALAVAQQRRQASV